MTRRNGRFAAGDRARPAGRPPVTSSMITGGTRWLGEYWLGLMATSPAWVGNQMRPSGLRAKIGAVAENCPAGSAGIPRGHRASNARPRFFPTARHLIGVPAHLKNAAVGAEPETAAVIARHRANVGVVQTPFGADAGKLAIANAPPRPAPASPNPQVPFRPRIKAADGFGPRQGSKSGVHQLPFSTPGRNPSSVPSQIVPARSWARARTVRVPAGNVRV